VDPNPAAAPAVLPLPNCYWVLPGKLLAGEHPGASTPELTRTRLSRLIESGVTCFIDLTEPDEMSAYEAGLPLEIAYMRRPIRDHSVPDPRHMVEILSSLHEALRAGATVYLHCRAGIGRTGMVAGCFLAEQGFSGSEALRELNRLWQQSARAGDWPEVPETAAQADYVRQWAPCRALESDPLFEPATLSAARGLRERFHGALLGLAAGDAVAVATQFGRPGRFTPVGDLLGGGPFDLPRGAWSDDTAMALCLAESLLECEGFDARDQVQRYRRWQQEGYLSATGQCVGITAATSRALAIAGWRRQPYSGSHDPQAEDPEPLSRVTPVAMYFFPQDAVASERAAEAARTTCQAPLALEACGAFSRGLHAALSGASKASILAQAALTAMPPARTAASPATQTASGALSAALDVFGETQNFRDAVLAAANLGGNSDVVAAAVGALAGAHYSVGAIPAAWRNSLMKKQLIEDFADRLLAHALLELGG
jgi:ADP-ribosylglycohydrolase